MKTIQTKGDKMTAQPTNYGTTHVNPIAPGTHQSRTTEKVDNLARSEEKSMAAAAFVCTSCCGSILSGAGTVIVMTPSIRFFLGETMSWVCAMGLYGTATVIGACGLLSLITFCKS
jgi:hypothetical protein